MSSLLKSFIEDWIEWEGNKELPTHFEVCGTCQGKGTHVNPSVDGHGIGPEEFAEDPEFADAYFGGAYDVTCHECKGKRVVDAPDFSRWPKEARDAWDSFCQEEASYQAMCEAERRMGA